MMRLALVLLALAIGGSNPPTVSGRQPAERIRVWIDTDPAVGVKDRDVDDGLALIQAFHSSELDIAGVSIVFGNASLEQAYPIGTEIAARFGPRGVRVLSGASGSDERNIDTDASRALSRTLQRERLTILALGPVTNIATVLHQRPELAARIDRIIAVAGRRPGQRFTTGTTNGKGHRDFNFESDAEAFRTLLATSVPLVLAPFEVSSKVWLTERDLGQLARGSEAARWIAPAAEAWLRLWRDTFTVDGFNPFDTLAVGYLTSPEHFTCERLPIEVRVLPDDVTEEKMQGTVTANKPYLLASPAFTGTARRVTYCGSVTEAFKPDLLRRLSRAR